MSSWTYVRGFVLVDVPIGEQSQKEFYLNYVFKLVPKVTGSEGCMDLIKLQVPGYNSAAYVKNKKGHTDRIVSQSQYYVVFHGNLRDREFEQTRDEVKSMLDELSIYLHIMDIYVTVYSYRQQEEFTDAKYYSCRHNSIELPKFIKYLEEE